MKKFLLVLSFTAIYLQAQKIENQEAFTKCRKEFDEKTCLSDEDKDQVLFYLDQCNDLAGPTENKGCPWPDYDKDGVPDSEDQCPETAGIKENYGCPETIRKNCDYFRKKDQETFDQFKIDNANIESIYNLINKNILDDVPQKQLYKSFIYVYFIENGPLSEVVTQTCSSDLGLNEYNFLITKFWNKSAIENLFKKYKSSVSISSKIPQSMIKDYEAVLDPELFSYLMSHYDYEDSRGRIKLKSKKRDKETDPIIITVKFPKPYQIEISYLDKIKKYEYNNQKWKLIQ